MFDIYCPHCGEPHDQDMLHDPADYGAPEGLSYMQAAALFKTHGCGLFKAEPSPCKAPAVLEEDQLAQIQAGIEISEYEFPCSRCARCPKNVISDSHLLSKMRQS